MRKLLLMGIMAMFTITTACGVETISEAENEQDTEETSKEQANVNSVVQEETANGNEAEEASNSTNTSDSEKDEKTILFSSSSEAIDYLRKELEIENNEDIYFQVWGDGHLKEDSYGTFYKMTLYSKETKAGGDDGKIGVYKVYDDGKYELAPGHVDKITYHFSSGSEAIDYLKKELGMENNEGISFSDMGGSLEKDSYGSYYEIALYVKAWKEDGGSGTAGIYKVYQDGKYELAYGYADKITYHFTSSSEAIEYLRKELDMENNEGIIFDDTGGLLKKDSYGSYYEIVLYVKAWKEGGGSGTAGIFKVYQDGKYESKY